MTRSIAALFLLAYGLGCAVTDPGREAPATDAPAEGQVPTADGSRLFYQTLGEGPEVVIVPARLYLYEPFSRHPELARGRRMVFYDMRNRGRSDAVADVRTLTVEQDVADLEAVRQAVGADEVSLIGFSYLGKMTIMYALAHPGRVSRVVQMGPVPMRFDAEFPPHLRADYEAALDPSALAGLRQWRDEERADRTRPDEYCEREWRVTRVALVGHPDKAVDLPSPCTMANEWPVNLARHFEFHLDSMRRADLTEADVGRLEVPVLTIHGTKDRNAPYGGGREWALRLPEARLLTLDDAAHASWVDAPEVVFAAIDRFLSGEWPDGAERVTRLDPQREP